MNCRRWSGSGIRISRSGRSRSYRVIPEKARPRSDCGLRHQLLQRHHFYPLLLSLAFSVHRASPFCSSASILPFFTSCIYKKAYNFRYKPFFVSGLTSVDLGWRFSFVGDAHYLAVTLNALRILLSLLFRERKNHQRNSQHKNERQVMRWFVQALSVRSQQPLPSSEKK